MQKMDELKVPSKPEKKKRRSFLEFISPNRNSKQQKAYEKQDDHPKESAGKNLLNETLLGGEMVQLEQTTEIPLLAAEIKHEVIQADEIAE